MLLMMLSSMCGIVSSPRWLGIVCLLLPTLAVGKDVSFVTTKQVDDPSLRGHQYHFVSLSKFGFRADQTTSVTFQVMACRDAHVGLMENVGDDSTVYDVIIGGWNNKRNAFFLYHYQNVQTVITSVGVAGLLACDSYTKILVSWQNGDIEIWLNKDGSWEMITAGWTIPQTFQVRAVGLTTGTWATGSWKINIPNFQVGTNVTFVTRQQVDDLSLPGHQYDFVSLSKFGFRADQTTSVSFQVRACDDTHVGLMENVGYDNTVYDVIIGGWNNTRTAFLYRYQDVVQTGVTVDVAGLLDCNAYRMFLVSWQNGDIEIWANKNGSWEMITAGWTIPQTFQVRDVGLTTGIWATGYWKINIPNFQVGTHVTFVTKMQVDDPAIPDKQFGYVFLSKFGFRADQTTSVTFQVRACMDAFIGLMDNVGDYSTVYDIVIGGWSNRRNVFSYRYDDIEQSAVYSDVTPPLDCNAHKMFLVSWQNGYIEIWMITDGTMEMITSGWTLPQSFQVRDVGFSTGIWATGYWKINIPNFKAPTTSLWTTLPEYVGIRMTNGILWTTPVINRAMCGLLCHMDVACWSFTYNTAEKTCQGHDDIFASKDDGAGEATPSSSYFALMG